MTDRQLTFDLPKREALGRDSYFVTPANALALALIDAPERWPAGRLLLTGPKGAGKSHLAHVWAAQSGGQVMGIDALQDADVPALAAAPLCLERCDGLAPEQETALFHLINLVQAEGGQLLLTARVPVRDWPLRLPDLRSRLEATATADLSAPDDALLAAVLAKLFADRQITPAENVIPYLVTRMPRSLAAAGWLVDRIDAHALATKGGATRDKAVLALADLDAARPFEDS